MTEKISAPKSSAHVAVENAIKAASSETAQEVDAQLAGMSRDMALELPTSLRLRWFYLRQVWHAKLQTVYTDLTELLEPTNEVSIISLVGMSGVGKTTLAQQLVPHFIKQFGDIPKSEIPIIYVRIPQIGDVRVAWKSLYHRIFKEGKEQMMRNKVSFEETETGEMRYTCNSVRSLSGLRDVIEPLLTHRKTRVLILDEAVHLLRFSNYAAIMDTIKSLSDVGNLKLLLIGSYDIVELVADYGQVLRRGEIVHYGRYAVGEKPREGAELTPDQAAFKKALAKFQESWPSKNVPNLLPLWWEWMRQSLGSVGLLKLSLLRLVALQLHSKGEEIKIDMLKKIFKTPKALQKMEEEAAEAELELSGLCYGDSAYSDQDLSALFTSLTEKVTA